LEAWRELAIGAIGLVGAVMAWIVSLIVTHVRENQKKIAALEQRLARLEASQERGRQEHF